ncbi:MAG: HEAT repeat domain-containing protein, partial [Planctomycetota bacterium]|nr:HEAT repeat domain-containing protein [Planctomycetota bacterium]
MVGLVGLLLILSPETERMLLGPSPFFRHEGMERAVAADDIALLQKAAASTRWDARRAAAIGLGVKTPVALLKDPVAAVREAAARALDVHGPEPLLLKLLADKDDAVRAAAAWALRARTNKAPLRKLWRDPSPSVRVAALAAAGGLAQLRKMASDKSLAVAVPALAMLGRAGGPADATTLLRRLRRVIAAHAKGKDPTPLYLQDEPRSDLALARALGEMARRGLRPGNRPLADQLEELVTKSKPSVSGRILLAHAVAGARNLRAAQVILDGQLKSLKTSTRATVVLLVGLAEVLHAFAREPWPELAPLLIPHLRSGAPHVRAAVARALWGNAAAVALGDPHPSVRAAACSRVTRIEPMLKIARGDESSAVLVACARALGRIGSDAAAPGVVHLLAKDDASVRRAAVGALLRVPLAGRDDLLVRIALEDDDGMVRAAAAAVLDFHGRADVILPRTIAKLRDPAAATRTRAIELIHRLTRVRLEYDPQAPDAGAAAWKQWWDKRTEIKDGGFRYYIEDLRRRGLDIVLVLDATGSMAPVIQGTKRTLNGVIETLRRIVPDLRARIVVYRDKGDAFLSMGS